MLHIFGKRRGRIVPFIFWLIEHTSVSKVLKNNYKQIARLLSEIETKRGKPIYLDAFGVDAMSEFVDYMYRLNYMQSTVYGYSKKLKSIINKASRRGYKIDCGFSDFRVSDEDAFSVYLNMDEINYLNGMDLSAERALVRDVFLVGCMTVQRYSDYVRIDELCINGDLITIKQVKTGNTVVVPVHPIVREVMARNNGFPKYGGTQQNFNNVLKNICKEADFSDVLRYERTMGGIRCKFIRKKYELVSSHTARRSGATNMYLAKMPTASIMLVGGWKTETSFFKYIRITKYENACNMLKHDFYK